MYNVNNVYGIYAESIRVFLYIWHKKCRRIFQTKKNKKSVSSKTDFSYKNPENNTDCSMNNYNGKAKTFTTVRKAARYI
jgi:hypothetical protein